MERERGSRDVERLGDRAGGQAVGPRLYEQSKDVESSFLGQGCED